MGGSSGRPKGSVPSGQTRVSVAEKHRIAGQVPLLKFFCAVSTPGGVVLFATYDDGQVFRLNTMVPSARWESLRPLPHSVAGAEDLTR